MRRIRWSLLQEELELIAEFQRTNSRFFSSHELEDFANGGPPPVLPTGNDASREAWPSHVRRGGVHAGIHAAASVRCATAVPMLNQIGPIGRPYGGRPGSRIANIGVSERNLLNLPVYTFLIDDGFGDVQSVALPDPGSR